MKSNYLRSISISDLLLVVIMVVVAGLSYRSHQGKSRSLYIYKDSHLVGIYDLSEARNIAIDEHVKVQIAHGKARISESDCPDKRCMKQGFNNNMPIICMPNHVVLEFIGGKEDRKLILY